jgi:hypothetical protein
LRLRFSLLALAVLATMVLAVESLASPQFSATFQMTYLSRAPYSSSGLRTVISWSDPGEQYAKPKAVKNFRFRFHPGARFDTLALPACKASDAAVVRLGTRACPTSSKLGSGGTQAIAGPGIALQTVVTLFNARRKIIVLVQVAGRTLTEFRDNVRGRTLEVNAKIPAGVALTKLDITIPAHSRKRRGKRRVYFRTPATCPASGSWTTEATLNYVDGSSQVIASDTPCGNQAS